MLKKLKLIEQNFTVTRAAFIVGLFAFGSKLLALIRDPLFASRFGGDRIYILDVYSAAFRIPDFLMSTFILGTLSVALIPIFVELSVENRKKAEEFANSIITLFMLFMGGLFLLLFIFAVPVTKLLVPDFSPDKVLMAAGLMRLIAFSQIVFTLSNISTNLLYASKRFIMAGIAPALYNLGIILGVVYFYPRFGINGLGYGVLLGAVLHLLIQLPELNTYAITLKATFNFKTDSVKAFFKLYLPRIFAVDLPVFALLLATYIGSGFKSGSIGLFTLAVNLLSLPVSIIALSLATAIFPQLSEFFAEKREEKFLAMLKKTLVQIFYFMVPLSLLMLVFRAQGVRLYLGHGNFTWENTILTFNIVGILAFALVSQALTPILSRAFYARQNTLVPVFVNFGTMAVYAALSFVLSKTYGILGVAAAFSIASLFNAGMLLAMLRVTLYKSSIDWFMLKQFDDELVITVFKILCASVPMAVIAHFGLYIADYFINTDTTVGLFLQLSFAGILGLTSFFALSTALKLKESQIILDYGKKILSYFPFNLLS